MTAALALALAWPAVPEPPRLRLVEAPPPRSWGRLAAPERVPDHLAQAWLLVWAPIAAEADFYRLRRGGFA